MTDAAVALAHGATNVAAATGVLAQAEIVGWPAGCVVDDEQGTESTFKWHIFGLHPIVASVAKHRQGPDGVAT